MENLVKAIFGVTAAKAALLAIVILASGFSVTSFVPKALRE